MCCSKNLFWLVLLLTTAGCVGGTDGPQTFTTSGKVTWKGEPIETGRIIFRMEEGDRKGFSAPIKDGSYSIETQAGRMRVEIRASRIIPGEFDESNPDEKTPKGEMYIPPEYNSRSTLEYNVTESSNHDISLTETS